MKPFARSIFACLLSLMAGLSAHAEQSRTISGTLAPLVEINVVPPQGTSAWSVEESFSGGAVSVDVSEEGVFDEENGKAKWGPFLDDSPRVLSYRITGPAGEVTIEGRISFDGSDEPVDTMDMVVLPDPESNFSGWRYLTLSGYLLHTLAAHPLSDMNLNGFNLLQEYAFGLFVPEIVDGPVILEVPGTSLDPPDGNFSYYRNGAAMDLEFTVEELDLPTGWMPMDLESLGASLEEIPLNLSQPVTRVLYQTIPVSALEGSLLRVRAQLLEL